VGRYWRAGMRSNKHVSDVQEMLKEWDFSKNDGVSPYETAIRTHSIYWWLCSKGHSWEASPHNRAIGKGCPYCANRKVLAGYNDLASQRPDLVSEWDTEKNAGLSPSDVLVTSTKKVWWKCREGHTWNALIHVRTRLGCNCPYCANRKVVAGYNDLATLKPELLSEWDWERNAEITPYEITVASERKVWWRCGKGHSWQTSVANRSKPDATSCPFCTNRRVLEGENDLATIRPELLIEWDYENNGDISPNEITSGSGRFVWWKCKNGHRWKAPVYARVKYGCPFCASRKVWKGFNDLASQRPDIMPEWDYEKNVDTTPESISAKSDKKVWWICKDGHSWQMSPSSRKEGRICPYCSGHHAIAGFNDLATMHPELTEQWDYDRNILYSPEELLPSSNQTVWWRCRKGHSWNTSPNQRINKSTGCPYCANKKVLVGYNDLATFFPKLAAEWDYEKNGDMTPDKVVMYSQRRVYWKCANGHSWRTVIANRSKNGSGCPYCAGQLVIMGENDLATVNPRIAAEWDFEKNAPLTPDKVMAGSGKKVWWKCKKGHSWKARIYTRKRTDCPYCSKHPIDMKTTFIS